MKFDTAEQTSEAVEMFGMPEAELIGHGLFNPTLYLRCNPDLNDLHSSPFEHFLRHGLQEGRSHSVLFKKIDYTEMYHDINSSNIEPFVHYCRFGLKEGRYGTHDVRLISESGLLDPDFYKAVYADVSSSGADPLVHYLENGAAEGRQPCAEFDIEAFWLAFPDIERGTINPVVHYLKAIQRSQKLT